MAVNLGIYYESPFMALFSTVNIDLAYYNRDAS